MAATADTETKNVGRIEEIQGVVIEAVFPEELPEIYSALTVDRGEGHRADGRHDWRGLRRRRRKRRHTRHARVDGVRRRAVPADPSLCQDMTESGCCSSRRASGRTAPACRSP